MTKYSKSSVLCWHLLSLTDENNMHPVPQKNSIIKEGDQRVAKLWKEWVCGRKLFKFLFMIRGCPVQITKDMEAKL